MNLPHAPGGEHGLMHLLQNRFTLQHVSQDMVEILKFPWERIYTTNFDNGIERALQKAHQRANCINNVEEIGALERPGIPVVHLHGAASRWDIRNFRRSCVLGADSYLRAAGGSEMPELDAWLAQLQRDLSRAEVIVFAGFSSQDFHLKRVFRSASDLQGRSFFVNRPTAEPDPDETATQERYGKVCAIGRVELARMVAEVLAEEAPAEPSLASFVRFEPPQAAAEIPSVEMIEDLLIWGEVNEAQIARDILSGRSDYHLLRTIQPVLREAMAAGGKCLMLMGEICDGKSIALKGLAMPLAAARPLYWLRHAYEDLLEEVGAILKAHDDAVVVIENCFDIRQDTLNLVARAFHGTGAVLILSSRDISAEAEGSKLADLRRIEGFVERRFGPMDEGEIDALIPLIDQIGGWRHVSAQTEAARREYIRTKCFSRFPKVLLDLLRSEEIKKRYREEFNKTSVLGLNERRAIICALYLSKIGRDIPASLVGEAFGLDLADLLGRLARSDARPRFIRAVRGQIETVPSIGASSILEHVIEDADIVDTVVVFLEWLAREREWRRLDFLENRLFEQLMRYSVLSPVVTSHAQINRFFDNVSKIEGARRTVLFWLQWHMAKTAMGEFGDAEKYLEMGYARAKEVARAQGDYDRRQLDDQKAKFLMKRARATQRSAGDLLRDFNECLDVVLRLMNRAEITHHPYETLTEFAETFAQKEVLLAPSQRSVVRAKVRGVLAQAQPRLEAVPAGYQREHADRALKDLSAQFN